MRFLAIFALACVAAVATSDASYNIRIYNECSDQLRLADAQSNATIGVYPPQTVTLVKISIPTGASHSVVVRYLLPHFHCSRRFVFGIVVSRGIRCSYTCQRGKAFGATLASNQTQANSSVLSC